MTLVMTLTLLSLSQSDPPDGVSSNPYLPTAALSSGGLVVDQEEDADLSRVGTGHTAYLAAKFLHHNQDSRLPAHPQPLMPQTLPENSNPRSRKSRSASSPGRTMPEEIFRVHFAQESATKLPLEAAVKVDIDQRNRHSTDTDTPKDNLQQSKPGSIRSPHSIVRDDAAGMQRSKSPGGAQPSEESSPSATGTRCVALKDPGLCGGGERAGGKRLRAGGKAGEAGRDWRSRSVTLPNLYGHGTVDQARAALVAALATAWPALLQQQQQQQQQLAQGEEAGGDARDWSSSEGADTVLLFLCTLYLPPCESPLPAPEVETKEVDGDGTVREVGQGGVGTSGRRSSLFSSSLAPLPLPLPCRPLCELARGEVQQRHGAGMWPANIHCHMFPTERCYALAGLGEVKYVSKALTASGTGARMFDVIPQSVAPLETELGDEDPFDVQVMTLGTNQIPPRRYDLSDLGDPSYFQGWADVQGTGAANDYCRVVGKGKRRFLACALAGTRGQDHLYVSKLGFEPGLPGTWFMRDVDSDGRDDYCRCIGQEASSRIVCMKAGEKGFYGSTIQGGSENTFELPRTHGCHHKHLNPHFGL